MSKILRWSTCLTCVAGFLAVTTGGQALVTSARSLPDSLQSQVRAIVDTERVDPGSVDEDYAACASGTVLLGGGNAVENDLLMTVTHAAPSWKTVALNNAADGSHGPPIAWRSGARNDDASPRSLNSAAICAPHSAVSTEVASKTMIAGANAFVSVGCPSGTVAVGGGVDVSLRAEMRVTSSGPTVGGVRLYAVPDGTYGAPDGWWAAVQNNSGSAQSIKVAAICQPLAGVWTVVTSENVAAGASSAKSAVCPTETFATGGGTDSQDIAMVLVSASAPVFGPAHENLMARPYGANPAPTGWEASVRNTDSVSKSFKVAAICARWPMEIFRANETPIPNR